MTYYFTAVRDDRETEIIVEFTARGGCAAQTYGLPENCYPAEPPEIEIIDCWKCCDSHRIDAPTVVLTDAENERICIEILESPDAIPDDYPEDY